MLTVILEILDGPVFTGAVLFDGHQAFGICRHGYHPFRQAHAEGVVCTPDKEKAVVASNQPARQPTKQQKKQTDTKKSLRTRHERNATAARRRFFFRWWLRWWLWDSGACWCWLMLAAVGGCISCGRRSTRCTSTNHVKNLTSKEVLQE